MSTCYVSVLHHAKKKVGDAAAADNGDARRGSNLPGVSGDAQHQRSLHPPESGEEGQGKNSSKGSSNDESVAEYPWPSNEIVPTANTFFDAPMRPQPQGEHRSAQSLHTVGCACICMYIYWAGMVCVCVCDGRISTYCHSYHPGYHQPPPPPSLTLFLFLPSLFCTSFPHFSCV